MKRSVIRVCTANSLGSITNAETLTALFFKTHGRIFRKSAFEWVRMHLHPEMRDQVYGSLKYSITYSGENNA